MATRTLITGASGLIGTWVQRHWADPGSTLVPVRHADVDLLAPGAAADLVARTTPARVVHLAWSASGSADYRTSDDNERWVDATLELVEAASGTGSAVWLTGTAVDDAADPADAYSRSKARLKAALAPLVEQSAIGWLRPYYVFDEARRRPALVDLATTARERNETLHLRSPDQHHDFVHASDVGSAIATAVTHGLAGEVPIGSGRLHSVADLVDRVGAPWSADPVDHDITPTHSGETADTTRLAALGWAPTRTEEFFTHA